MLLGSSLRYENNPVKHLIFQSQGSYSGIMPLQSILWLLQSELLTQVYPKALWVDTVSCPFLYRILDPMAFLSGTSKGKQPFPTPKHMPKNRTHIQPSSLPLKISLTRTVNTGCLKNFSKTWHLFY